MRLNEAIVCVCVCVCACAGGISSEKSAHSHTRIHASTPTYIITHGTLTNESYSVLVSIENKFYLRENILSIDLDKRVILGARNQEI